MPSRRASIPGMIEPIEQELLRDLAAYAPLQADDIICEFGCYLGLSARCIAEGLLENRMVNVSQRTRAALHAFDVFSCSRTGAFARYLSHDAKRAGLENLLVVDDERIDFARIFDHHMADLPSMLIQRHQTDIASASHPGGAIAMMHVDAPKWASEYLQLMLTFGPHLKPRAQVVFQDYFYHWSAGLIAALQLFIEEGCFEPLESAASALLVRTAGPIDGSTTAKLAQRLATEDISSLIERAVGQFRKFELDRPELFLPRLYLAGVQHEFEQNRFDRSTQWLERLTSECGGTLPPQVMGDIADLTRYGFSMRRLYELDTSRHCASSGASATE